MKPLLLQTTLAALLAGLLAVPTWAVRPIDDLRTPNTITETVSEKVIVDVTGTSTKNEDQTCQEEVERIQQVLRLDELNRENTIREALRQEQWEDRVRSQEDLQLAMAEKNVDLHLGKTLTDMHGNRVRMEEYVLRPEANQVQFLNLTLRTDRLDYINYNAYFNDILPRNLDGVWAKEWQHVGEAGPHIYLESESIEYSNLQDKVNYGVEYFSPTWEPLTQKFVLPESGAHLAVNDIQKAYHRRETATEDIIWHGIAQTHATYIDKNLLATRIKYVFDDGTFLQIDDYRIGEDGSLRQWRYDTWDNFVNDLVALLENFSALVFNTYKERIMTATEFEGRDIDTVSQFMHLVDVFDGESERPWR